MSDAIQYKPISGLNETSLNKIIEMSGKDLATKEDVNKAVSNVTIDTSNLATKSELRSKVDKEEGKGLSTEDFTTEYKNKLEGLSNSGVSNEQISAAVERYLNDNPVSVDTSNLATKTELEEAVSNITIDTSNLATKSEVNNKVDKVTGKGLSANDYTTSEKK